MDPQVAWDQLMDWLNDGDWYDGHGKQEVLDLSEALHTWLSKGGFMLNDWIAGGFNRESMLLFLRLVNEEARTHDQVMKDAT